MKKVILVVAVLFLVSCGVKTPYDTFRKVNKDNTELSFGVPNFMLRNVVFDEDVKEITKKMVGIKKWRLLVSKEAVSDFDPTFTTFVHQNKYEELLKVSRENNTIHVYTYAQAGKTKEALLKVYNGNHLVIISAEGKDLKFENLDLLFRDVKISEK